MDDFTKSFLKIIPSLRKSTEEVVFNNVIQGERLIVPVEEHSVEVYLHRTNKENAPVLFEMHGGGFVIGEAAKDDFLCEKLKDDLGIHVIGINYRKAPEHPYPAAVDDVMGVLMYFGIHGAEYGMNTDKFIVMGCSAGANLATVAAMKSKDISEYRIICQILHYPALDFASDPENKESYPADLPLEVMKAFSALYTSEANRKNPYVSPLLAPDDLLADMPYAVILPAKEDALCKEGLAYSERLKALSVPVTVESIPHAHHGYIEDYYNKFCYDLLPDDTKEAMNPKFKEAAEYAIQLVEELLKGILK